MRVKAKWRHSIEVTREVEIDEEAFTDWVHRRYGEGANVELALTVWLDDLDTDTLGEVFADWRTDDPLPDDFVLAFSEVIDAELVEPGGSES